MFSLGGEDMILTDEKGRGITRPERSEFTDDVAFARAYHAWKDRVTAIANESFDATFCSICRGTHGPEIEHACE